MPRRATAAVLFVHLAAAVAGAQRPADEAALRAEFERRLDEELAGVRARLLREFDRREPTPAREDAYTAALRRRIRELERRNAELRAQIEGREEVRPPPATAAADPAADEAPARIATLRRRIEDLRARGVPESDLRGTIEELDALAGTPKRATSRRFLGVVPGDVSKEWRERHGIPAGTGVRVVSVVPGSAAEKAGLAADDVLLELDGRPLHGADDLARRVAEGTGDVRLRRRRGDAVADLVVTPGTAPGAAPSDGPRRDARTTEEDAWFREIYEGAVRRAAGSGGAESRPSTGSPPR